MGQNAPMDNEPKLGIKSPAAGFFRAKTKTVKMPALNERGVSSKQI